MQAVELRTCAEDLGAPALQTPADRSRAGDSAGNRDHGGLCRAFDPAMLEGKRFAIAAVDDREVNRAVAGLCWERGVLVNTVDDKGCCTLKMIFESCSGGPAESWLVAGEHIYRRGYSF